MESGQRPEHSLKRSRPTRGVNVSIGEPTIVFLTVCAKDREPWIAQTAVQESLGNIWKAADAWVVGYYLLMPDHLHLFCAPRDITFTFGQWLAYWKSQFSRSHRTEPWEWQRAGFHHRMRSRSEYTEKWTYVRENPVRKGLVQNPDDWSFWGMIHELRW